MVFRSAVSTELPTSQGRTSITDEAVATIAVLAARRVPGIHSIGGGAGAPGAVRGPACGQGASVEIDGRWAVVDLEVVVEYGVPIAPVVAAVRRDVADWVQTMTGFQVVEVNITVEDLHLPGDDGAVPVR